MDTPSRNKNLGIIGMGFVGSAVFEKFKPLFNILTYDIKNDLSNSSLNELIQNCEIIFICLPTPMNPDGSCNFEQIDKTLEVLNNKSNAIIINKSTVPPGSSQSFSKKYRNLSIVFNPEFLTEKNAINDFKNQNRIILGGNKNITSKIKKIYSSAFSENIIFETSLVQAEIIKYYTNCFLACKVSFANEMYELCNKMNTDYNDVLDHVTLDKRIEKSHLLVPGHDGDIGYGGHCLPKDLSALINTTNFLESTNNVLKSIKKTNDKLRKNKDWKKMKGRAVV